MGDWSKKKLVRVTGYGTGGKAGDLQRGLWLAWLEHLTDETKRVFQILQEGRGCLNLLRFGWKVGGADVFRKS